jgi:hypothetical protein
MMGRVYSNVGACVPIAKKATSKEDTSTSIAQYVRKPFAILTPTLTLQEQLQYSILKFKQCQRYLTVIITLVNDRVATIVRRHVA